MEYERKKLERTVVLEDDVLDWPSVESYEKGMAQKWPESQRKELHGIARILNTNVQQNPRVRQSNMQLFIIAQIFRRIRRAKSATFIDFR